MLSAVITPFFDDNGNGVFDDNDEDPDTDECSGDPITLTLEVRPAPTVSVAVSEDLVCDGDIVTVTITASEAGIAQLILGEGGAPIEVPVVEGPIGVFTGTYSSEELDELTMFTVTTFMGAVADCEATVNQMVMTAVEERPGASLSVDNAALCDGDEATVTLTGSGGAEDGYKFDIEVSYDGGAIGPAVFLPQTVITGRHHRDIRRDRSGRRNYWQRRKHDRLCAGRYDFRNGFLFRP